MYWSELPRTPVRCGTSSTKKMSQHSFWSAAAPWTDSRTSREERGSTRTDNGVTVSAAPHDVPVLLAGRKRLSPFSARSQSWRVIVAWTGTSDVLTSEKLPVTLSFPAVGRVTSRGSTRSCAWTGAATRPVTAQRASAVLRTRPLRPSPVGEDERERKRFMSYGADRVKTIGRLYVPSTLLALEKSLLQVVLKKEESAAPFVAEAPEAKVTSLAVIAEELPAAEVAQARSPIGFTPAPAPAYVQLAALLVLIFRVQLRLDLTVNVGPASCSVAPASMLSAVGFVKVVVAELMSSFTSAPTETDAVLVALQLPLPIQPCADAWLEPRAVPSTIAARTKRVEFIGRDPLI